jgi:uncharacterized DUF497 family protein
MRFLGFDWDETNERKLAAHHLTSEDVEGLFDHGRPIFMRHPARPDRLLALGFVPDGRFVLAVFEYHAETRWVRVVTAYEAEHERWWATYSHKTKSQGPR